MGNNHETHQTHERLRVDREFIYSRAANAFQFSFRVFRGCVFLVPAMVAWDFILGSPAVSCVGCGRRSRWVICGRAAGSESNGLIQTEIVVSNVAELFGKFCFESVHQVRMLRTIGQVRVLLGILFHVEQLNPT